LNHSPSVTWKAKTLILAAVCACVFVFPTGNALSQSTLTKVTLLSGTVPQQVGAPAVAAAKGFFKDEGLNVEYITFTTGVAAGESFTSGQGDFIIAGDFPSMKLWTTGDAVGIVPHTDAPDALILVSKASIKSAGDLAGKKVATQVGSTLEAFVYKYLDRGGVSPSAVKLINLAPPEMVIALDGGEIDAYAWVQPYGWRSLEVSGDKVHILATAKGLMTERVVLNVRKSFAQAHPDVVERMVRAIVKGSRFITAKPAEGSDVIAKFLKLDVNMTARIVGILKFDPTYSSQFRADMDGLADFMVTNGKLSRKVAWSNDFAAQFLSSADPKLVQN
jgi:sulfonate transport system substrate-binding protein